MRLRKPRRDLPVRRDEIDVAELANAAARRDARATQARTSALARRVAQVHAALMHEGARNHFTERVEAAYRGSR